MSLIRAGSMSMSQNCLRSEVSILDKFEEQMLFNIGIAVRDSNGDQIPTENIIAEFEARWPSLTPYQQIITAMIITIIYRRYYE